MKIISIEGGIGAGKSTLVKRLGEILEGWEVIQEPVDSDPEFHRLLKQFIDNPNDADKRAEFQMYITRVRQAMLKNLPDGNYIIERSLYSDLVFTQCNMLTTEGPTGAYTAAYYDIKKHLKEYPVINNVIYLSRCPTACLKSTMERDRAGEDAYSLSYFEDVHRFHQSCLPQICREYGAKYHEVDCGDQFANPELIRWMILKGVI